MHFRAITFFLFLTLLTACAGKTASGDVTTSDQAVADTSTRPTMAEEEPVADAEVAPMEEPAPAPQAKKAPVAKAAVEKKAPVATPVKLTGKKWIMSELMSKTVKAKNGNRPYHITLEEESQFTAYAGCNSYSGSYKQNGSKIKFTNVMGTKMACDDMKEENYLNEVLRTVDSYRVRNGELQLMEGSDVVARFR